MARKGRKRNLRKKTRSTKGKIKRSFKRVTSVENRRNNLMFHRRPICCRAENVFTPKRRQAPEAYDLTPGSCKKPKKLRTKPSDYKEDECEGKCRFQEDNSSSEEESAMVRKSKKVINEEKKENTKSAQKKHLERNEDSPARCKPLVEKHARKVNKQQKTEKTEKTEAENDDKHENKQDKEKDDEKVTETEKQNISGEDK